MDEQSEEFPLLLLYLMLLWARLPECAFLTQMHAFPFSVQRGIGIAGV